MISRTKRGICLDMQARRASRVPGATPKRANHETRPTPGTANGAIVSSQTQPLHPRRRIRVATTGGARRSSCRAVWAGNDDVSSTCQRRLSTEPRSTFSGGLTVPRGCSLEGQVRAGARRLKAPCDYSRTFLRAAPRFRDSRGRRSACPAHRRSQRDPARAVGTD